MKNSLFLLKREALKQASFSREGLEKRGSRMKTPGGNEREIWIIKLAVANTLPPFDSDRLRKANRCRTPGPTGVIKINKERNKKIHNHGLPSRWQ